MHAVSTILKATPIFAHINLIFPLISQLPALVAAILGQIVQCAQLTSADAAVAANFTSMALEMFDFSLWSDVIAAFFSQVIDLQPLDADQSEKITNLLKIVIKTDPNVV